jgi:tetratricopeptide (TPR) repeat protein
MSRSPLLLCVWLLAGAASLLAQAPPPAGEEPLDLAALEARMARAEQEFAGEQQSGSIVLFDEIIEQLAPALERGPLPERAREILLQAYELRGRAYYGIGLQDRAAESFRRLIQTEPRHTLSRERVSPKIVGFFDSLKAELVGYIAVVSRPAGARVSLNGRFLSLTDFFPMEVLAGTYDVEIAREGYRTETRSVTIGPKAQESLEVDLVRTLASFFFVTEPAGVEIWIGGELRATTAGTLAPDRHEAVRQAGLDPMRASARTEVANVPLGTHEVEFRRRCYAPLRRVLEVAEPLDYDIEPVRLEDSVGTLRLASEPPGALILLDGEAMGQTPRELARVCSGPHRLEVKHASGKFIQDIVLARDETLSLDCPIRPSLAFLGAVAETARGERLLPEVEERVAQNLARLRNLNFIPARREVLERVLAEERLTRRDLVPGLGVQPDVLRRVTEKLAAALEVQGFLIALVPDERLQRTAVLHVLAAGNTVSDTWSVTFSEPSSYLRFVAAMDRKATVYQPWTGLVTIDTQLHEGVPILRVVPGSPAERAGIAVGEEVYAVDGAPLRRTRDLLEVVRSKRAGESLALQLRGAGGSRAVNLELGTTPQEVALHDPELLYNKIMMDLRQQVEGYPGTETAAFARLNLGICAVHFGDFAAAHEHWLKARGELPGRPGLSAGTAAYYLATALERLGLRQEAVEAFNRAAGYEGATLLNNDGPLVAPLAKRRAGTP